MTSPVARRPNRDGGTSVMMTGRVHGDTAMSMNGSHGTQWTPPHWRLCWIPTLIRRQRRSQVGVTMALTTTPTTTMTRSQVRGRRLREIQQRAPRREQANPLRTFNHQPVTLRPRLGPIQSPQIHNLRRPIRKAPKKRASKDSKFQKTKKEPKVEPKESKQERPQLKQETPVAPTGEPTAGAPDEGRPDTATRAAAAEVPAGPSPPCPPSYQPPTCDRFPQDRPRPTATRFWASG